MHNPRLLGWLGGAGQVSTVSEALPEEDQTGSKSGSVSFDLETIPQYGRFSGPPVALAFGKLNSPIAHLSLSPNAGKAAIESGLAAVLEAAGGLFRMLGKGKSSSHEQRFNNAGKRFNQDITSIRGKADALTSGNARRPNLERRHAASLLFSNSASLFLENLGKLNDRKSWPSPLTAILPPFANSSSSFMRFPTGNVEARKLSTTEDAGETVRPKGKLSKKLRGDVQIVEPKTGVFFPRHLGDETGDHDNVDQVLAGVGARAQTFIRIKSILIYAFGLYVEPNQLRKSIGGKYAGIPPEELKYRRDFYDDLLQQEVDMTMRLVVHYRGLKMGMVRSAFESALQLRLRKIHGADNDNGLTDFCSLMSGNFPVFRGTTIDFRRQAGGALQAEIGGQKVGRVFSHRLCRAFFAMYIGDPPVSEPAKLAIGEGFARMLTTSSTN